MLLLLPPQRPIISCPSSFPYFLFWPAAETPTPPTKNPPPPPQKKNCFQTSQTYPLQSALRCIEFSLLRSGHSNRHDPSPTVLIDNSSLFTFFFFFPTLFSTEICSTHFTNRFASKRKFPPFFPYPPYFRLCIP